MLKDFSFHLFIYGSLDSTDEKASVQARACVFVKMHGKKKTLMNCICDRVQ